MKLLPIVREAGVVLLISCVLGIVYSLTFSRGVFSIHSGGAKDLAVTGNAISTPAIISLQEAYRYSRAGGAVFLDARHEFEYAQGHIDSALNIPVRDFEQHVDMIATLPRDGLLITYCDGGGCNASIELAAKLAAMGFRNVKVFYGGWQEWETRQVPSVR